MPTKLFFRNMLSSIPGDSGNARFACSEMCGRQPTSIGTATAAGSTGTVLTQTVGGITQFWITEPLIGNVTISGNITINLRGRESANSVNAGLRLSISRSDINGLTLSTISAGTVLGAELGTAESARTGTRTPTSTAMLAGDRIVLVISTINVGTMGAGNVTFFYDGPTNGGSGDSFVTFTENFRTNQIMDVSAYTIYGTNGYTG